MMILQQKNNQTLTYAGFSILQQVLCPEDIKLLTGGLFTRELENLCKMVLSIPNPRGFECGKIALTRERHSPRETSVVLRMTCQSAKVFLETVPDYFWSDEREAVAKSFEDVPGLLDAYMSVRTWKNGLYGSVMFFQRELRK